MVKAIESIFISEFNDHTGRQLLMVQPKKLIIIISAITPQEFKTYEEILIPDDNICNKIIAIVFKSDFYLINYSGLISNTQLDQTYQRQKYKFSVAVIVKSKLFQDNKILYYEFIRKLMYFFGCLQLQRHILYKSKKEELFNLVTHLYSSIIQKQQLFLEYKNNNYMFFKFELGIKSFTKPYSIEKHEVPISSLGIEDLQYLPANCIYKRLMEAIIPGDKNIRKIADQLEIPSQQIIRILRYPYELGVLKFVDIFDETNCYIITKQFPQFISIKQKWLQAKHYVVQQDYFNQISQLQILHLYMNMCKKGRIFFPQTKKINNYKFIRFGQVNGFLRRCHEHLYTRRNRSIPISIDKLTYRKHFESRSEFNRMKQEEGIMQISSIVQGCMLRFQCLDEVVSRLKMQKKQVINILKVFNIEWLYI